MKNSKKTYIQIRLFFMRGSKRTKWLRKKRIFASLGENSSYRPFLIPPEPDKVYIGKNVKINAGVRFITHDIIDAMLNAMDEEYHVDNNNQNYTGVIKIGNNVNIGADSIILYNKSIGNNVIIAAGSVVTKNIPDNEVWGGNPAKRICSFDEFVERRKNYYK